MKKISKILLSILGIYSMFFTMTVNAEERTLSKNQNTSVTQETTKIVSDLTQEELNTIIPNEIEITTTKTDMANYFANTYSDLDKENPAEIALKEKIVSIFSTNGYTIDASEISVFVMATNWEESFIEIIGKEITKDFTIKYTKESGYNEQDATYVKNKVDSIKFANYEGADAVFTIYNLGDEEGANKWTRDTFDFGKLLSDRSITIKKSNSFGGQGGGTPWGELHDLYFYKNDILYFVKKDVQNMGAYGITLENGTPVNMAKLEQDDEIYKTMAKELKNKGFINILGCYELEAYGPTTNNMKVSFNLGSNYNGKEVQILHKKKDNTYEIFKTRVSDGKVEITVRELSPFMIALSDSTIIENVNKAPNNAQTSSMDIVLYSILILGSLVGITYILVSNKKKEIA